MEKLNTGLYIISTPIGNLQDISFRAKTILEHVDFVICENPIHSLKLLNNLGIKKKLFSLHDYNEASIISRITKYQENSAIALISDAGSPLISDPGYNLVNEYIKKGLMITTIPGPTSIISALQLSGLPIHNFDFFGFVPKNKAAILSLIKQIRNSQRTSVYFVSNNKLIFFLESLLKEKILRRIAVCKEISKKNERVFRGKIQSVIEEIASNKNNLRGEFVVVLEGNKEKSNKLIEITIETQIEKLLNKFSLTEVVEIVHKLTNISKKEIYKTALKLKND